jgi:KUP system potassium uptake protein
VDNKHQKLLSLSGLIVTLGIIFGDIGTSPLYVLKEIVGESAIDRTVVLGAISCIFWTLTLQTTLKYVVLTLRADNNGEGGIFSLYALIRRRSKWIFVFAIIGGSALLADGMITPPISVSSAIEGLRIFKPDISTVPIVLFIITGMFLIQQFGTNIVGKSFGPIMLIWFLMLALLGIPQIFGNPEVIKAVSPYYAYKLLAHYPHGFWLLGAVFLCTTGAEALYSDLGHCGKENIRVSWAFVKACLLLNYFGQGAWLINHHGSTLQDLPGHNPFYGIMPGWFQFSGVVIATLATIIASQALISGSFTLVSEAMRLNFWPKVKINYPTFDRGQMYVPSMNWILLAGCIGIVLYFQESSNMGAAYGLSITITMLMTTFLLCYYLYVKRVSKFLIYLCLLTYLTIETAFLIANLSKFAHGAWVTLFIGTVLFCTMWIWYKARKIKNRFTEFVGIQQYLPLLKDLSEDQAVPKYATHLVYLTSANRIKEIEAKVIYSILNKHPKRADIYWFIHVEVLDQPYTLEYKVDQIIPDHAIRIEFRLGFKIEPKINMFLKEVIENLVKNNEVNIVSRYPSLQKYGVSGDFRFVVIDRVLNYDYQLNVHERLIMKGFYILKFLSLNEQKTFGLDTSLVTVETVPLVVSTPKDHVLKRIP